jgi:hypothetical protein
LREIRGMPWERESRVRYTIRASAIMQHHRDTDYKEDSCSDGSQQGWFPTGSVVCL